MSLPPGDRDTGGHRDVARSAETWRIMAPCK